jgi:phosphate transport system permease protein
MTALPHDAAPPQAAPLRPTARPDGALGDRIFHILTGSMAWLVLLILAGAAIFTFMGGWLAFKTFGWHFLVSDEWDPVNAVYGAWVPIFGTLVSSVLALVIAVPISLGIAVFLTEVAPRWMRGPIGTAIELLAAIPSIIYGMWGLFAFGPFLAQYVEPWINDTLGPLPVIGQFFAGPPLGIGMLPAGVILGIMIIPFIASVMRDVFSAVPPQLKESAVALGATPSEVVHKVILPYTSTAVIGSVFLGLGRALGETMAVTFVIGNATTFSQSLLMPGTSIAALIASEFNEASEPLHRSALIALAFILFAVTFIVLAAARLMLAQVNRNMGTAK